MSTSRNRMSMSTGREVAQIDSYSDDDDDDVLRMGISHSKKDQRVPSQTTINVCVQLCTADCTINDLITVLGLCYIQFDI
ncbi:hypothetical protein AQUCO_02400048v1 [Aquilegia coerulea]|uniref:Uncharacterized protein n=1 Tax=Aquilegia coerulea TaxID=218851 RepID=A0A2G5DB17_AQUCA|nr:hypothetical protein AQUCO_02400048v1 [Aquilegia coerulea]